ncbi:hypothetical protein SAMN05414139_10821 [Burkholderia sp. D7]|nr:hypothetical protein SAMN05414139_10821 [Burkholderia sp. D7]
MSPDRIIKYVQKNYRLYWRRVRGLDCESFSALLDLSNRPLQAEEYSRLTNSKSSTPKRICQRLEDPIVLARIENSLDCRGLFECASESEIDALMRPTVAHSARPSSPTEGYDNFIVVKSDEFRDLALHPREEKSINHLLDRVTGGRYNVVCWTDPPPMGSSFVAYMLASNFSPKCGINNSYVIKPRVPAISQGLTAVDGNGPVDVFARAMEALCEHLNLRGRPSGVEILEALRSTQSVLFVLNAECIAPESRDYASNLFDLISEARLDCLRKRGPAPIVLIGKPPIELSPGRTTLVNDMGSLLAFASGTSHERSDFFEAQWRRFCEIRNNVIADDVGARLKRARQYYNSEVEPIMWPSSIRLLAFFASNYETFSYFDPTAGWDHLAALPRDRLPADVRMYLEEAQFRALTLPSGKRQLVLRALRWCSTALYWLTDDAVTELGKAPPRTTVEGFRQSIEKVPHLVQLDSHSRGRASVYRIDLTLRAVLQEQWTGQDALGRACVHYQIAKRLYHLRDNKEMLPAEFPVEPHWGRSSMQFLAESIRHLMRACGNSSLTAAGSATVNPYSVARFPVPPNSALQGCDPVEVVNFCFGRIFWQELNGNSPSGTINNRKLSRQHGAYQLTGELLQLMSQNNRLGEPHWALSRQNVARYLREVAYAQLDLGDLPGAQLHFERLIALASTHGFSALELLDYELDLVVALAARNELDAAQVRLDTVSAALVALRSEEFNPDTTQARLTLEMRFAARQAQLHYLRGDIEGAIQIYRQIESQQGPSLVRDVAQTYIAALGATKRESDLRLAMSICIRNLFENTSHGLHHEALGFRVALGHLFRRLRMTDAAEATLDQVYHDILQYGCSERTFLAFLLEAGRTVAEQDRFARAYAAYLRPCLDRAQSRGYVRVAEAARRHCQHCLTRLRSTLLEEPEAEKVLHEQLVGRGNYLSVHTPAAIDPLYAYDVDASERWVGRLTTLAGLERELAILGR